MTLRGKLTLENTRPKVELDIIDIGKAEEKKRADYGGRKENGNLGQIKVILEVAADQESNPHGQVSTKCQKVVQDHNHF